MSTRYDRKPATILTPSDETTSASASLTRRLAGAALAGVVGLAFASMTAGVANADPTPPPPPHRPAITNVPRVPRGIPTSGCAVPTLGCPRPAVLTPPGTITCPATVRVGVPFAVTLTGFAPGTVELELLWGPLQVPGGTESGGGSLASVTIIGAEPVTTTLTLPDPSDVTDNAIEAGSGNGPVCPIHILGKSVPPVGPGFPPPKHPVIPIRPDTGTSTPGVPRPR
jgi:hypothetical protein